MGYCPSYCPERNIRMLIDLADKMPVEDLLDKWQANFSWDRYTSGAICRSLRIQGVASFGKKAKLTDHGRYSLSVLIKDYPAAYKKIMKEREFGISTPAKRPKASEETARVLLLKAFD